jgi:hypothetical protein
MDSFFLSEFWWIESSRTRFGKNNNWFIRKLRGGNWWVGRRTLTSWMWESAPMAMQSPDWAIATKTLVGGAERRMSQWPLNSFKYSITCLLIPPSQASIASNPFYPHPPRVPGQQMRLFALLKSNVRIENLPSAVLGNRDRSRRVLVEVDCVNAWRVALEGKYCRSEYFETAESLRA